jgi:hypothetical protein
VAAPPATRVDRPTAAAVPPVPSKLGGARALPQLPWALRGGVTDEELVAAVRSCDVRLLRLLYDHAVRMGWIADASDDAWLRFLTACHHAATARLNRRMGRLVAFVRNGLDVGRCPQACDAWAGRVVGSENRDPLLARRVMSEEVF